MNNDELKITIEKLLQAIEKDSEPTLDMFACAAMQGLMILQGKFGGPTSEKPKEMSIWAYRQARAMMEERKKWIS